MLLFVFFNKCVVGIVDIYLSYDERGVVSDDLDQRVTGLLRPRSHEFGDGHVSSKIELGVIKNVFERVPQFFGSSRIKPTM